MNIEIERKWLLKCLPNEDHPVVWHTINYQSYLSVEPVIRVRRRLTLPVGNFHGRPPQCFMTVKGEGTLSRPEIEFPIDETVYKDILHGLNITNPIFKDSRYYQLMGYCDQDILAHRDRPLRVDVVDENMPNEFIYAEVEFVSEDAAKSFEFPWPDIVEREVTGKRFWTMAGYWDRTRLHEGEIILEDDLS